MKYQIGGSLASDASSYVERKADPELYQALKQGQFCYVLSSRQMGKSSLLVRTMHRLQQEGFKCAIVDMTNIGGNNITSSQWYKGIVTDLWSEFQLSRKVNLRSWWQEQEGISSVQKLSNFISEILLAQFIQERLFIFIDEIDSILSLDFSVDDFFALIRYCYNRRTINPKYQRITFAISGVATPSDLIKDKQRTPFNIGQSIELQGFKLPEALALAAGFSGRFSNSQAILKEILAWTGGQPFLTQKLCNLVANLDLARLNIEESNVKYSIASLVRSHIIDNWESQDEPEHLRTMRSRILGNEQIVGRLLGIYQQILAGQNVPSNDSREQIELILSGLVVKIKGKLQLKNQIYQNIFNVQWVATQLENLRPYAQSFIAWINSQQQDNSQLLRGLVLKQALVWAENQKLSDLDYRFLSASQELENLEIKSNLISEKTEREKAEFALAAAKQANLILVEAKKTAKLSATKIPLGKRWILGFAFGVTCLILLLRLTGLLQGMEWNLLDYFFQQRPQAGIDPRISIITIDESDLQKIGQYPIPDKILAQALKNLKNYQPEVIGLTLFRDLPVEPGNQELLELFQTTPNLISLEKIVGNKVASPPILAQLGQVGFADQILDGDGKVRRALLTVRPSEGKIHKSLALQLALRYLKTFNITPRLHPDNRYQMQLGKALLIPFQPNDGGYVNADSGGYQILLNYHGTEKQFSSFSITDLLAQKIPKQKIENRVVLIGVTAESVKDFFQTPYSSHLFEGSEPMSGVFIHANITSQILSAALSGKGILQTWSEMLETLWILLWSGLGVLLSWRCQSPKLLVTLIATNCLALILFSYLAFLQGWWIPVFPPFLGLIVAAIILPIFSTKQLEKIQLYQTVKLLVATTNEQPAAGQIAIEYLKQSENQENQALIEKIINDLQSR